MSKIAKIEGKAIPVEGNDIDTDRIIPARYLKEITFTHMGKYPFMDERVDSQGKSKGHPFDMPQYQGACLLLVNQNFGCGSSREHAPQALMRWGIKAILGESFAEIFAGNCTMLGIPTMTVPQADIQRLQKMAKDNPKAVFTVDLEKEFSSATARKPPNSTSTSPSVTPWSTAPGIPPVCSWPTPAKRLTSRKNCLTLTDFKQHPTRSHKGMKKNRV